MKVHSRRTYYVYLLSNASKTRIKEGLSGDIFAALNQWKCNMPGKPLRDSICRFVYYEIFEDIQTALIREKELKSLSHKEKCKLISTVNPDWVILSPHVRSNFDTGLFFI